ncbi:hypothetical protein [Porphyrobacter sp. GA68]|nr:hypothetical protein [Porphyrobacter sp. GA68]
MMIETAPQGAFALGAGLAGGTAPRRDMSDRHAGARSPGSPA